MTLYEKKDFEGGVAFVPKKREKPKINVNTPKAFNIYNIHIIKQGLCTIVKKIHRTDESTFTFNWEENDYKVEPTKLFPVDWNFIKAKLYRIFNRRIQREYNIFFKEGQTEALSFEAREKITPTLLQTVLHSQATKEMLKKLPVEGVGLGIDVKKLIMLLVIGGVGFYLLVHFKILDLSAIGRVFQG